MSTTPTMSVPVLGYWTSRVLAQPIRFILNYVGEEFEDRIYEVTDGPEFSKKAWRDIKDTFGLEFPNLPYYIDGDVKICQSNAILTYLGRKYDLLGKTEPEHVMVDVLLNQQMDVRTTLYGTTYHQNYEEMKGELFKQLQEVYLPQFENRLQMSGKWCAGENFTVADFALYELFHEVSILQPAIMLGFPYIQGFMAKFESLPAIQKYMATEKYKSLTLISNKHAGIWKTNEIVDGVLKKK